MVNPVGLLAAGVAVIVFLAGNGFAAPSDAKPQAKSGKAWEIVCRMEDGRCTYAIGKRDFLTPKAVAEYLGKRLAAGDHLEIAASFKVPRSDFAKLLQAIADLGVTRVGFHTCMPGGIEGGKSIPSPRPIAWKKPAPHLVILPDGRAGVGKKTEPMQKAIQACRGTGESLWLVPAKDTAWRTFSVAIAQVRKDKGVAIVVVTRCAATGEPQSGVPLRPAVPPKYKDPSKWIHVDVTAAGEKQPAQVDIDGTKMSIQDAERIQRMLVMEVLLAHGKGGPKTEVFGTLEADGAVPAVEVVGVLQRMYKAGIHLRQLSVTSEGTERLK